jgi:ABC-type transport system involved in multi-copper enzyme maturation permease subunit
MIRRTWAIAQITILETLSRKHVYVLLMILVAVYYGFGRIEFFNLGVAASFVKLIPVTGVALFGAIIATFAAARQVPAEITQRTIFPLLAKPVTRFEFLAGKFLGVCIVMAVAVSALSGAFQLVLAGKGIHLNRIYWQAVVLLVLQLSVFVAIVIALSTVMHRDATIVMGFLLYYLLGSAGSTLEDLLYADAFPSQIRWFYQGLLYIIPRLDLFNISKAILHDVEPRSWSIVLPFVAYAFCCCTAILSIGALAFRRKDL